MATIKGSKALGAKMHNWHGSAGDPIYAVGSQFYAGHPVTVERAEEALEGLRAIHRARVAIKLKPADVRELNAIIADLAADIRVAVLPRDNPARFRLYDNGGETADRYTLIDSRPEGERGREYHTYFGFSRYPTHPQGIGQHGELTRTQYIDGASVGFKHIGKRIGLEDLAPDLRKFVEGLIREWGGDPKSALRGKYSLAAKSAKKASR